MTASAWTEELGAGPIIHQDVAYHDSVDDLARLGREIKRRVLARVVRWHSKTTSSWTATGPSSSSNAQRLSNNSGDLTNAYSYAAFG